MMASKTSAGKSGKKGRKSKDQHGDFAPIVKKKISISGGKITDVEAQVVDEETELANAQFQSRLKTLLLFMVVVLCIVSPYFINFTSTQNASPEENVESFLKVTTSGSSEKYGQTILGAKIEELIGNLGSPPPNCAIFYSDDPEFNPKALATRICPDRTDNHIAFHIKGVFGTHPNNTQYVKGEKAARVKFVSTGKNVWTHFFNQHHETSQTFFVSPGNDIDMITLTNQQISKFYENFDTVKVMNADETVGFRFKGTQVLYPDCANYYGSNTLGPDVDGFILCHHKKSKYIELRPGEGVIDRLWNDVGGRIQPLQFVQVGKRVTTFLDFDKNAGMERITMEAGTTHDLMKEAKLGAASFELRPKFLKLTTTDPNIKGGPSSKRYVAQKLSLTEPDSANDPVPAPAEEEEEDEDEEGVMEPTSKKPNQIKSLDELEPVPGATTSSTSKTDSLTPPADEDEGTVELYDKKPASSMSSGATSSSGTKAKREVDDDEQ